MFLVDTISGATLPVDNSGKRGTVREKQANFLALHNPGRYTLAEPIEEKKPAKKAKAEEEKKATPKATTEKESISKPAATPKKRGRRPTKKS